MALAAAAGLAAVPTGIDHGTVTLLSDGQPFEVTTFRRDVETFGRHATVAFSTDIAEDAARRDFTMNALYAEPDGTLVDPLGGLADLRARRVRFVGDPARRIAEDYLRILRFFRIHAWYGDPAGGLDPEGLAACAALQEGLDSLSRERVGAEIAKLLAARDPAPAVAAMAATGILARVLPGADPRALAPLVHLEAGAGLAPRWQRRLAALGGRRRLARPPPPVARRRPGARRHRRFARRRRARRRRRLAPRCRCRARRGADPRRRDRRPAAARPRGRDRARRHRDLPGPRRRPAAQGTGARRSAQAARGALARLGPPARRSGAHRRGRWLTSTPSRAPAASRPARCSPSSRSSSPPTSSAPRRAGPGSCRRWPRPA